MSAMSSELRDALAAAHMVPLWESPTAHKLDVERERAHVWAWRETGSILRSVGEIGSPEVVERRVLSLVNPISRSAEDEATTGVVSATLQMLLPGERARPHRHSMNALRFVLEGAGAETIVDGKHCPMEPGDLIITPAWCWHEHVANGSEPTIWVDVLDVALHLALGTDAFQPGPVTGEVSATDDAAFAVPNVVPAVTVGAEHSPVFRYPLADAVRALSAAPVGADGVRRVRYVNPLDGGAVMPLLDCTMVQLDSESTPAPVAASTVCVVVKGSGTSVVGEDEIAWERNDVFTLPRGTSVTHRPAGTARVFMVSNREVYERLGLLHAD